MNLDPDPTFIFSGALGRSSLPAREEGSSYQQEDDCHIDGLLIVARNHPKSITNILMHVEKHCEFRRIRIYSLSTQNV